MKIYCINLPRRTDRKEYMLKEAERVGMELSFFNAYDIKPGWMGCALSHLDILMYESVFNVHREPFMILEDDVQFIESMETIGQAFVQLPPDWDMLYLGVSPKKPQERYSAKLFRLDGAHVTHAIMWNPRDGGAMDYIIEHSTEIKKIDDYFATVIQPKFNCFVTYPMVATQIQTQSDTCKRSDLSTILKNYNKYCT